MNQNEMEMLAFIISKELGSVKGDEELLESIQKNCKLFGETAKKLAEPSRPTRIMKSPYWYEKRTKESAVNI